MFWIAKLIKSKTPLFASTAVDRLILPAPLSYLCSLLIVSFALAGCGGGSTFTGQSSTGLIESQPPEDKTKLHVNLTDAEGDFLSYTVKVEAISLQRANGSSVNLLPQTSEIDFSEYVEVTELLTIANVPTGRYVSASLSLDFSDAEIVVQNVEGKAIEANVLNTDGSPATRIDIAIRFNDRDGFFLSPSRPAHITLDFDLDASNEIQFIDDSATVTVSPIVLADTILEDPKPRRIKGLIEQLSIEEANIELLLRPFRHRSGFFGTATIHTDIDTQFEINGNTYLGEEGLSALASLNTDSNIHAALIAEGQWNKDEGRYLAQKVYAGSSVPWGQSDLVHGTVTARTDNQLKLRGVSLETHLGKFKFIEEMIVELSPNTHVILPYHLSDALDTVVSPSLDQISIGSRITISGSLLDDNHLNANNGFVRIGYSNMAGTANLSQPLSVNLDLINGLRVSLYDFSGSGTNTDSDSSPSDYSINSSTLNLDAIAAMDPLRIRGLVSAYGSAPEDFIATSLVNAAQVKAHIVIGYPLSHPTDALLSLNENGLVFDLEDSLKHQMYRAGIANDLKGFESAPRIYAGEERGLFSIVQQNHIEIYTYFTEFIAALNEDINAGHVVSRFDARGYYDSDDNSLNSKRMKIRLVSTPTNEPSE